MRRMNIRTTVSGLAALGLLLVCGCDFPAVLMLLAAWGMHEYAHLLTSEVLGYSKGELQLTSFGGRLNLDPLSDINAEAEYLIAVSGPLANWLMVLGVWYLKWLGVEHAYLAYWQKINCLLGTLNLIPAWPLDGGRLVHAWLNRHFGMERAVLVSRVLAGAVAIFSFGCGAVLLVNQRGGSLFIIVGGFIAAHWIQIKNPPFVLSWRLLQHKASRLKTRGLLEARLVMVNPGTLLREALQTYGNNDYLLFCFFGPGQELWMVSEDLAWKALVAHGFNTTFLETMKAGFTVNLQKLPR